MVRQLHDSMLARVVVGGAESHSFPVTVGGKQGCVLAPILFNTYLLCVTVLLHRTVGEHSGININFRYDRSLFDLKKLQAKTKTSPAKFHELQYADDCALVAHSLRDLQNILSNIATIYTRFGLRINVGKTEVLHRLEHPGEVEHNICIGDTPLTKVQNFKYL
jgi:hypothetical protein